MRAGFFATDITPPIGTVRAGNYRRMTIEGAASSLKVRAAVFESGGQTVALAGVDVCYLDAAFVDAALRRAEEFGARFDGHVVSASHVHTGGAVTPMCDTAIFADAPEGYADLLAVAGAPDAFYRDYAIGQLATALVMAHRRLEPALLAVGKGREGGRVFNRRFRLADGRAYTHPGKGNPDIIAPAGPIDDEVGVLGARRPDGSWIGAVVNYACHGTTRSELAAHGDWYFYLEETLTDLFGSGFGVVALNGACGDITQVDNNAPPADHPDRPDYGDGVTRELGLRVGAEAAKALISAPAREREIVRAASTTLTAKRRRLSADEVAAAWKTVAEHDPVSAEATFARERLLADWLTKKQPERALPLAAIQIGDALVLSNPAELFCSLGLAMKKASAFPLTMVVELANDIVGYVPDDDAFSASGGGYETAITAYSNLQTDTGRRIVAATAELAAGFHPETAAPPPPAPGTPWNYGTLGPDRGVEDGPTG